MLLFCSLALADIIPDAPTGKKHITHSLRIEGLEAHPDIVLLAMQDAGDGELSAYRVFDHESNEARLANGASRSSGMATATIYLMTRADYDAWAKVTAEDVRRQEELCEQGIGCAHISRFEPTYATPESRLACGATITTQTSAIIGGSDRLDVYRVVEASPTSCRLEEGGAKGPDRSVEGDVTETDDAGCSHVNPLSFGFGALLLLLVGRFSRSGSSSPPPARSRGPR